MEEGFTRWPTVNQSNNIKISERFYQDKKKIYIYIEFLENNFEMAEGNISNFCSFCGGRMTWQKASFNEALKSVWLDLAQLDLTLLVKN